MTTYSETMGRADLAYKTVLEVGSGRGATTRTLVDLLAGKTGAQLIVTDISDAHFSTLQDVFRDQDLQIQFVQTAAHESQRRK